MNRVSADQRGGAVNQELYSQPGAGHSIAVGWGIPAVQQSAECAQGTSVLTDPTRSARAAARGDQRVSALTTSDRERHQDNETRRERAA